MAFKNTTKYLPSSAFELMFRCSRFYWINWHKHTSWMADILYFYIFQIPHILLLENKIFICAWERNEASTIPLNTVRSAAAAVSFRALLIDCKANKTRALCERKIEHICRFARGRKVREEENLNDTKMHSSLCHATTLSKPDELKKVIIS